LKPETGEKALYPMLDKNLSGVSRRSLARIIWGVKIPIRDGIYLNGTLYLPSDVTEATACVVTLTPYISDSYHEQGVYFSGQAIAFMIVDVRGRGNSEGIFRPMVQEANDGYDVIEWVAQQPYCNGKVAMWGGSYSGHNQWAAAKEFPPHLNTIVPAAAPFLGVDFPMRNNIFYPYVLQWIIYTAGRALQTRIFNDQSYWSSLYREWYTSGRPFRDLDAAFGTPSTYFQEWLDHPEPDGYWDTCNPTVEQYQKLKIPILTITGIYDDDQPGALEHYRRHVHLSSSVSRERHYLIMGPWDHAGTRTPGMEVGGIQFGKASLLNLPKLHADWYLWTMGTGERPAFLKQRVAYYVTGAERWRYIDSLEKATAYHQEYFLDSAANASDVFSAGMLIDAVGGGLPDHYRFDPNEIDTPELEAESYASSTSLVDQSVVMAMRGKLLVYHTAPFTEEVDITGFFKLSAWLAIDTPDTDFYVSVHEIEPQGRSIRLATDGMRARYRTGVRSPKLIDTNGPLRYDFDRFTFISRQIGRGSRLRLIIAPIGRLIDGTFVQKNFNSGGVVTDESKKDGRPVTVRLFHDSAHPSVLHVPIGHPRQVDELEAPPTYFNLTEGLSL
jgi:uncharacterized protein